MSPRPTVLIRVVNFIAFYIGWFACVLSPGRHTPWLGPLVVAGLVGLHLWLSPRPSAEARLVVAVGIFGWLIDTGQSNAGVFTFAGYSSGVSLTPPWMVALWMSFATTLGGSMQWLRGRYALAAGLGFVSGPLSYHAGARLGGIVFPPHPWASTLALAVVWGVTMPVLLRLADYLAPVGRE